MNAGIENLKEMGRRYKKWIVVAAVSGFMVMGLAVLTFGFVTYKAVSFASEKIKNVPPVELSTNVEMPKTGFVEEVILGVAQGWIKQSLATNEIVSFKNGLACFDAVGGPSPVAVVDYLKARLNDQGVTRRLDAVADSLENAGIPPNGSLACVNWILSS